MKATRVMAGSWTGALTGMAMSQWEHSHEQLPGTVRTFCASMPSCLSGNDIFVTIAARWTAT